MPQDIFDELDAPPASSAPQGDVFDEIAPDKPKGEFIPRLSRGVETGVQDVSAGFRQQIADTFRSRRNPFLESTAAEAQEAIPALEQEAQATATALDTAVKKPFSEYMKGPSSKELDTAAEAAKTRLAQAQESAQGRVSEPFLGSLSRSAEELVQEAPADKEAIRERYKDSISDTRDPEFWNTVADSLGQSIPSTAATILNQPLGLSLMYAQTYGQARDEFIESKKSQGLPVNEEEAGEYAMSQANAQTPLELVGDVALAGTIGRSLGAVFKAVPSKTALVKWIKSTALDLAKSVAGETLITTPGQTIAEQKIAEGASVRAPMSAGELARTTFQNMKVAGAQSFLMGGGPVAVSGAAQATKSLLRGTIKEEAQKEIIERADSVASATEGIAPASAEALRIKARQQAEEAGAKIDETLDQEDQKKMDEALKQLQESIAAQEGEESPASTTEVPISTELVEGAQFAPPPSLPTQETTGVSAVEQPLPEQEAARARVEEAVATGQQPDPADIELAGATITPASEVPQQLTIQPSEIIPATDQRQGTSLPEDTPIPTSSVPTGGQEAVLEGAAGQQDVTNPRAFKLDAIQPPETVEGWVSLRNARRKAEIQLIQEEIGVTPEQAEIIHRKVVEQGGTGDAWASKNLTPEQNEKFEQFWEESEYNQKNGPVDFLEYDSDFNPELLADEKNPQTLAEDIVLAFTKGAPKEGLNDKWIWTVSALRKLQELGGTKEDIGKALAAQSVRVSGSQSTANEWFVTHGKELNDIIERFAPGLGKPPTPTTEPLPPQPTGEAIPPEGAPADQPATIAEQPVPASSGGEVVQQEAPKRVQLKVSPQSFEIVRELPQTEVEKANDERFFEVRNERTGEISTISQNDIAREIRPKSERVKRAIKKLPEKAQRKAEIAVEIDVSEDPYQGTPLTDAEPLTVEENLDLLSELASLGVLDEGATGATILQNIVDHTHTPQWAKTLAKRLLEISKGKIDVNVVNRPSSGWYALYSGEPALIQINLARRNLGVTNAILHETSHHITLEQIRNPESLTGEAKKAYDDLVAIHKEISTLPEFQGEYGVTSVEEMVAEAFSNAGFRRKLDGIKSGNQTLWQKLVNAIARLLFNKPAADTSLLHRAIEDAFTLAGAPVVEARGNAAMADADRAGQTAEPVSNETSQEADRAYFEAVKRKDLETSQRMVDEAAKKAGAIEIEGEGRVYHGTSKDFAAFQTPAFFTDDPEGIAFNQESNSQHDYGDKIKPFFLFGKFSEVEVDPDFWGQRDFENHLIEAEKDKGFDGVILTNGYDYFWVAFDPAKIKSADPVTYDKSGNIIPLSRRFPSPDTRAPSSGNIAAMAESGSWETTLGNPNASTEAEAKALTEATQEVGAEPELDVTPLTDAQRALLEETETFKPLGIASFFAKQFSNIPGTDFSDRQGEAIQGLVKAARSYNPESGTSFFQYANVVIRNHMRDFAKSRKVRSKYVKEDRPVLDDDDIETVVSTAPSPKDITIQENDRNRMRDVAKEALTAVMSRASERDRNILRDYASGMNMRDVGTANGVSAEGVRKILARYRENVSKALFLRGINDLSEILAPTEEAPEPAIPTRKTTAEDENEYVQSESRLQAIIEEISLPGAPSERESISEALREEQDRQEAEGIPGDEESDLALAAGRTPRANDNDRSATGSDTRGFGSSIRPDPRYLDPSLESTLPETLGAVAAGSDVVARYDKLLQSLGVGTYSNNEGTAAIFNTSSTRAVLSIDPTKFFPNNAQNLEALEAVLSEELIHVLDGRILRERYGKTDTTLTFDEWSIKEMNNMFSDLLETSQRFPINERLTVQNAIVSALNVYAPDYANFPGVSGIMALIEDSKKDGDKLVAHYLHELARMLVQQEREGKITEKTRNDLFGIIRDWLSKAYDYIKQLSGMVTKGGLKDSELGIFVQDILELAEKVDSRGGSGEVAPMAEGRTEKPVTSAEKEIQKQVQKALIENQEKGKTDIRDNPELLSPDLLPDAVPTQVMGQLFTVAGRQRLDSTYRKEAMDHAKDIFDQSGLKVIPNEFVDSAGQQRITWKLADDFEQQEEGGQKLLELLRRELASQDKEGAKPLSVLIDSIRGNMRDTEAFTQNLRQELFSNSQSYASMLGIKLRALAGIGKSLTDVVTHIPVYLNRIYSDTFNGDHIDSVLQKFRENLRDIFEKEELDKFLQNQTAFQDTMEKLLRQAKLKDTGSKKGVLPTIKAILEDILNTPFYNQEDIYTRFKDRLEQEFNISPEISTKAQKFLKLAFERKFKKAKERALEITRKSLTPQEKKSVGPSSPLWEKIVKAANAGFFDAPTVLQNIAEQAGWKIPTAEQIASLKRLAGEEQKMRELTDEEKSKIGNDPEKLILAQREKAAATLNKRAQLKKQMQGEWAKFSTPQGHVLSKAGWVPEARKQRARMLNEYASANLLFTPAFAVKQIIDVGTQMAFHLPTRAIAAARMNRKADLMNGNPTRFVQDSMEAIGDGFKNQLSALKVLGSTLKQTLKGKTEARNVDALFSSTSVFDRLEQDADRLWAKGDPKSRVTAVAMKILGIIRMSYRFAQALDMLQGNQTEAQEMHEQVVQQLRENGMDPAEARRNAQEVMGDTKAEWIDAIARAKNIFDANGIDASPSDIQVAAWEIVKSRQYYRMSVLGLDAEANQQSNYLLKNTLGWNEAENGGIGAIFGAIPKAARKWGEDIGFPMPFALFGNAIATGINRTLTTHGIGLFPAAFKNSPWFAGEKNQAQRKVEASVGLMAASFLLSLGAAGILRVRNWWPEDEEEKQTFEREGHRPGTVEVNLGEGRFIPLSLSSGPLQFVRGYLAGLGAVQDASEKNAKKKSRAQERAGDAELRFNEPTNGDYANIAATAAISTLLQGRTAGGLGAQFSDQGNFSAQKIVPGILTPAIPFLPANNQVQRMAGANIDPKKADLTQLLFPTPNSTAQRTNSLGDSVSNPNAVQRISQMLTGGTYLGIVDEKNQMQQRPYDLIYKAGWVPPPLNAGQYRNMGNDFRPMNPEEVQKYYKSYGEAFKDDVANVPESLSPELLKERLQDAHKRSREKALQDVGVQVD